MHKFTVGNKIILCKVRENSSSNYLILNLRKNRVLEISFPRNSRLSVKKILEKKRPWIERKYKELSSRKCVVGSKRILYLGRVHRLKIYRGNKQKVRMQGNRITINMGKGQSAKKVLTEWMAQKSKEYAMKKAVKFGKQLGINPKFTVDVKDMRGWGRCIDKQHLVFNWQLIGLPVQLAEYVVAHEITHLAEGSHSKKFARKLAAICSQYKELREELKNYFL